MRRTQVYIPLIVFTIALLFGCLISAYSNCSFWNMDCWWRWDSALYLDIAQKGHVLEPCVDLPGKWCGNAGWAPLYPFLIRIVSWISGCELLVAGWILSRVFFLGFLLVMGNLIAKTNDLKSWILMLLAAFAPGTIYAQAIFPISLAMFLLVLHIYFLFKHQYLWAGICPALLVWSYSTGFVFLGCSGIYLLAYWYENNFKKAFVIGLQLLLIPMLALAGLFLYDQLVTGHWNAMFLIQSKYGHSLQSPFKMMGLHWQKMMSLQGDAMFWVEVQHMTLLLLAPVFIIYMLRRKNQVFSQRLFFATWAFLLLFFPYSMSLQVSLYRSAALLTPLVFLLRPIPLRYMLMLLALWIALALPLGRLFIESRIV